jgi:hypothetical protein
MSEKSQVGTPVDDPVQASFVVTCHLRRRLEVGPEPEVFRNYHPGRTCRYVVVGPKIVLDYH